MLFRSLTHSSVCRKNVDFSILIKYCKFSSISKEPEHMVSSDVTVDPASIKIPFLREATKNEIYALYKSDPKTWTVTSRHF